MPRVQYTNNHRNESIAADMITPKRIGELKYWLKGAQKAIPKMPQNIAESEGMADNSIGSDGWFVATADADLKWIKFSLENRIGEKAHIVIARQQGIM